MDWEAANGDEDEVSSSTVVAAEIGWALFRRRHRLFSFHIASFKSCSGEKEKHVAVGCLRLCGFGFADSDIQQKLDLAEEQRNPEGHQDDEPCGQLPAERQPAGGANEVLKPELYWIFQQTFVLT